MLKSLVPLLTPSSEGLLVRILIYVFGVDWKSSLSGFLSLVAITCVTLIPFISAKIPLAVMAVTAALCKAWVLFISKDAGTQLAKVPGIAEPIGVPSHEVPDSSSAKVVK